MLLQNSSSGGGDGRRKGNLSKKLPFFKMKDSSPYEEKEGKICLYELCVVAEWVYDEHDQTVIGKAVTISGRESS